MLWIFLISFVFLILRQGIIYILGWTLTPYTDEDDLKMLILLFPPPMPWDYGHAPPYPVFPIFLRSSQLWRSLAKLSQGHKCSRASAHQSQSHTMYTLWPHLYKPLAQNTDTLSILRRVQVTPVHHEKTSLPVSRARSYSVWNLSSISWRSRERSTHQSLPWANLRARCLPWALRGEWITGPNSLSSNPSCSPSQLTSHRQAS